MLRVCFAEKSCTAVKLQEKNRVEQTSGSRLDSVSVNCSLQKTKPAINVNLTTPENVSGRKNTE
jgi:hypothetical protein